MSETSVIESEIVSKNIQQIRTTHETKTLVRISEFETNNIYLGFGLFYVRLDLNRMRNEM